MAFSKWCFIFGQLQFVCDFWLSWQLFYIYFYIRRKTQIPIPQANRQNQPYHTDWHTKILLVCGPRIIIMMFSSVRSDST